MDEFTNIIEDIKAINPAINIQIDWEQYFKDFCEAHGKYPVMFDGVLLFPDGYRYSSTEYEGPEYPPPSDRYELTILQEYYWKRRKQIIRKEHDDLKNMINELERLQREKTIPLSQVVQYRNDQGDIVTSSKRIDMVYLRKRLEWLANDLTTSEQMLDSVTKRLEILSNPI